MLDRTRILIVASLVVLACASVAGPAAAADILTVTLTNGQSFETRYHPREADWDPNMVMVMTDMGNWIGIPRQDIASVISETEAQGYGTVIDSVTVDLGWSANDAPVPGEVDAATAQIQALQNLLENSAPPQSTDTVQFVSPGLAGRTGGLPVGFSTGPSVSVTPVVPAPRN